MSRDPPREQDQSFDSIADAAWEVVDKLERIADILNRIDQKLAETESQKLEET